MGGMRMSIFDYAFVIELPAHCGYNVGIWGGNERLEWTCSF